MIQKLKTDPIIEEIHSVRREICERFGGDVRAIAADANARMLASGCLVWQPAASNPLQRSGEVGSLEVENLSSPPAER